MPHSTLPPDYVEAVAAARGRRHVFPGLEPVRTALVVVDMQNAFVAPGAPFEVAAARAVVPAINRLAERVRATGGKVVWIQATQGAKGTAAYYELFFENFVGPDKRERALAAVREGSAHHALYDGLDVRAEDRIVRKSRASAFIQGASDIEPYLRDHGIDTLLITGTATNVCCESTARDAAMLGFRIVMVEDANAAASDDDHLAGLRTVLRYFGDVRPADEVIGLLEAGAERTARRRAG